MPTRPTCQTLKIVNESSMVRSRRREPCMKRRFPACNKCSPGESHASRSFARCSSTRTPPLADQPSRVLTDWSRSPRRPARRPNEAREPPSPGRSRLGTSSGARCCLKHAVEVRFRFLRSGGSVEATRPGEPRGPPSVARVRRRPAAPLGPAEELDPAAAAARRGIDIVFPYMSSGASRIPIELPSDFDIFSLPSTPSSNGSVITICASLPVGALDLAAEQEVEELIASRRPPRRRAARPSHRPARAGTGTRGSRSTPRPEAALEVVALEHPRHRLVRREPDELRGRHRVHPLAVEPDLDPRGCRAARSPAACRSPRSRLTDSRVSGARVLFRPVGSPIIAVKSPIRKMIVCPSSWSSAQLVERDRMAQVKVRRRRVAAVLDPQRRALRESGGELPVRDQIDGPRAKALEQRRRCRRAHGAATRRTKRAATTTCMRTSHGSSGSSSATRSS